MDVPVWLLDVDGVLNGSRTGWGGPPSRGTAVAAGFPWPMRWEPKAVACVRTLHMAGLVEVRWCSTWCPHADQLERLWQLPTLGRAWTEDLRGLAAAEAKLDAARKVLADGRRLVWTDDMEVPEPGSQLYDELTAGGRALLICPQPSRGLRPEDFHTIERFARAGRC